MMSESTESLIFESAERNRNWGRWGDDDQIGTLNFITSEKILEAAALVKTGQVISMGLAYDGDGPQNDPTGRANPIHAMNMTGADNLLPDGLTGLPHQIGFSDDMITMYLQCGTQWDGLGHCFDRGKMYNGYGAEEVTALRGAIRNGIEHMKDRVVTRGVLLDVPRAKGVETLEPGYAITADDLNATIEAQGPTSQVRTGDAVMVRTGQMTYCRKNGWGTYAGGDAPGLSFYAADWLHDTEIAALATDTWGAEVRPNELEGSMQPLHQVMIPNIGLLVGEIFDMTAIGEACAEDGNYEFMFVCPPLEITGAVGSPITPLALR
jgi:kynurenine formamidase